MSHAKTLKQYGEHGRTVRVYTETTNGGTRYVRVRWREGGRRRTESFHDTRENRERAHAYAKGVAHRLDQRTSAPPPPITLYDLFNRYIAGNPHWRPSQLRNVKARWKKFQAFAGMGRGAHTVTKTMLDEFRAEMAKPGAARSGKAHAVNQIAQHVKFGQGSLPVRTRSRPDPRESPGRIHGQDAEGPGAASDPRVHPRRSASLVRRLRSARLEDVASVRRALRVRVRGATPERCAPPRVGRR